MKGILLAAGVLTLPTAAIAEDLRLNLNPMIGPRCAVVQRVLAAIIARDYLEPQGSAVADINSFIGPQRMCDGRDTIRITNDKDRIGFGMLRASVIAYEMCSVQARTPACGPGGNARSFLDELKLSVR
jgi:stage V sporulation protein SpoVS